MRSQNGYIFRIDHAPTSRQKKILRTLGHLPLPTHMSLLSHLYHIYAYSSCRIHRSRHLRRNIHESLSHPKTPQRMVGQRNHE